MENVSAQPMLQRCHIMHMSFPARCICLTFGTGVSGRCVIPTSPAEVRVQRLQAPPMNAPTQRRTSHGNLLQYPCLAFIPSQTPVGRPRKSFVTSVRGNTMSEQRELQKIECLVGDLHTWRSLQRIVSAYQAWRGHLRVRVLVPAQRPWMGTALGVLRYEASSEAGMLRAGEERVLEILVQREDDHSTAGVLIEHLQAVEILW